MTPLAMPTRPQTDGKGRKCANLICDSSWLPHDSWDGKQIGHGNVNAHHKSLNSHRASGPSSSCALLPAGPGIVPREASVARCRVPFRHEPAPATGRFRTETDTTFAGGGGDYIFHYEGNPVLLVGEARMIGINFPDVGRAPQQRSEPFI
jgi:hypothetical protein